MVSPHTHSLTLGLDGLRMKSWIQMTTATKGSRYTVVNSWLVGGSQMGQGSHKSVTQVSTRRWSTQSVVESFWLSYRVQFLVTLMLHTQNSEIIHTSN